MTTRQATTGPEEGVLDGLAHALRDIRTAHDAYVEEQTAGWRRYTAAVDRALEEDLGAEVGPELPIDELARELLDGVRGRMDDLRVQARLGRMEVDDLVAELRHAAATLADALRP